MSTSGVSKSSWLLAEQVIMTDSILLSVGFVNAVYLYITNRRLQRSSELLLRIKATTVVEEIDTDVIVTKLFPTSD